MLRKFFVKLLQTFGFTIFDPVEPILFKYTIQELKILAEQDVPSAQSVLVVLYYYGIGVRQDYEKAYYWYQKIRDFVYKISAEPEFVETQKNMGLMYYEGQDLDQDYQMAYYWLSLAVAHGDTEAEEARVQALSKLTPEQIQAAEEMIIKFKPIPKPQPE